MIENIGIGNAADGVGQTNSSLVQDVWDESHIQGHCWIVLKCASKQTRCNTEEQR